MSLRSASTTSAVTEALATVGAPTVANASVTAEVVDAERKDKKILIFKMKRRKTYRLKKGHRQRHSIVKITGINA